MKFIILFFSIINFPAFANEARSFYLHQVDYRHRPSVAFGVPGISRIRIRPSYEFRYRTKKGKRKSFSSPLTSESFKKKPAKTLGL